MFCSNCGNEINDGSTFCSKCGAKMENENPAFETVNQSIKPNNKELPKFSTRFHTGKKILMGLIIIIILSFISALIPLVAVVAFFFLLVFWMYLIIAYCNFVKKIEKRLRELGDIRGIKFDYFLSRIEMPKKHNLVNNIDISEYHWRFKGWKQVNYYLYVDRNGTIVDVEFNSINPYG